MFRNDEITDHQSELDVKRNSADSYQPNYFEADPPCFLKSDFKKRGGQTDHSNEIHGMILS